MGRKKKKQSKPWCWYCNREFDDEKILIQHQKAKHFKCHICHKKLYTGPGLSIHCMQVHKETIDKVPNSLPNRSNIEIEIYGMEGIPEEDLREHERQKQSKSGDVSDEEEPLTKKVKSEPSVAPRLVATSVATAVNPYMTHLGPIPHYVASMNPYLTPGMGQMVGPIGLPPMPGLAPPVVTSAPGKPLFPAAQNGTSSTSLGGVYKPIIGSPTTVGKPAFPAYSQADQSPTSHGNSSVVLERKPALIQPAGATSKIVHPEEDISLEERRARFPKYLSNSQHSSLLSSSVGSASSSVASGLSGVRHSVVPPVTMGPMIGGMVPGGNLMRAPPIGLPSGPPALPPYGSSPIGVMPPPVLGPPMFPSRFR